MQKILEDLKKGRISVSDAEKLLREQFLDIYGIACLDLARDHRTGVPEVVLAEDKTIDQIVTIAAKMLKHTGRVIISRLTSERKMDFKKRLKTNKHFKNMKFFYHETAKLCIIHDKRFKSDSSGGRVGIITAGTTDIPVAEEARLIVEELGCTAFTAYDIGVAGAHRLVEPLKKMVRENVDVLIVLAGREGALPTLIAGIVDIPVIAVPISTGYGIEGKGKTALYAMLQSCSPLVVVNIDAGFVAAAVASKIANRMANARKNN